MNRLPCIRYAFFAFLGLIIAGCDLLNPKEDVPIYLKIETPLITILPDQNIQVPANVKDVWIDHNENFVGVYPVPSVIPIYPDDRKNYLFSGGVVSGGLSAFRQAYDFWLPTEVDIDAAPGDTVVYRPTFEYLTVDSAIIFALDEQFEGSSLSFKNNIADPQSVEFSRTSQDPFLGNASGLAEFSTMRQEFEALSTSSFALPQRGSNNIFIEVTYKNDIPFTVGLIYSGSAFGTISNGIYFAPTSEWNTIYINYNDEVRQAPVDNTKFQMFIKASGQGKVGKILFDNIRIVHFK